MNFGILGICFVDTFYLYQAVVHPDNRDSCPNEFFSQLADELVDNTVGERPTRRITDATNDDDEEEETDDEEEVVPVLVQTIKQKPNAKNKSGTPKAHQGRCMDEACKSQTTMVCNVCTDMTREDTMQYWFCSTGKKGHKKCWENHVKEVHSNSNNDDEEEDDEIVD